jgi:hypothetical protein
MNQEKKKKRKKKELLASQDANGWRLTIGWRWFFLTDRESSSPLWALFV